MNDNSNLFSACLYYQNGKKKYEGNFKNGFIIFGSHFNENGSLIYKGQFVNNLFHGQGTQYLLNSFTYIGNFVNGKKDGFGNIFDKNNKLFIKGLLLVAQNLIFLDNILYIIYNTSIMYL